MSLGYGGLAKMMLSDDSAVVYEYCCYNLNNENYKDDKAKTDGEIFIARDAFIEPEIREKRKKTRPEERKRLLKK